MFRAGFDCAKFGDCADRAARNRFTALDAHCQSRASTRRRRATHSDPTVGAPSGAIRSPRQPISLTVVPAQAGTQCLGSGFASCIAARRIPGPKQSFHSPAARESLRLQLLRSHCRSAFRRDAFPHVSEFHIVVSALRQAQDRPDFVWAGTQCLCFSHCRASLRGAFLVQKQSFHSPSASELLSLAWPSTVRGKPSLEDLVH